MSDKLIAIKSVIWTIAERALTLAVQFVFSILIARQLMPGEYGIVAVLTIFLTVASIFIDSGFSSALIRKMDRNQTDFSTIFFLNLFLSIAFYLVLFVSSGKIAGYFQMPELKDVTKVIGLTLIFNSISIIQITKLKIEMNFALQAKVNVVTILITSITGYILAVNGFGVWTLVAQNVLATAFPALFYWTFSKWKPSLVFSVKTLQEMFSFGSKLLISGLFDTLYKNFNQFILGKYYSASVLGLYNTADSYSGMPSNIINSTAVKITYPLMVKYQNDNSILTSYSNRIILLISYFSIFFSVLFVVFAESIVLFLLTDKWIELVPFLQILSVSYVFIPVYSQFQNLFQIKGKSDVFLKVNILSKILGFLLMIASAYFGAIYLAISFVLATIISNSICIYYVKRIFSNANTELYKEFLKILSIGILSGVIVFFVVELFLLLYLKLILGILIYLIIFVSISYISNNKVFKEIIGIVKTLKSII